MKTKRVIFLIAIVCLTTSLLTSAVSFYPNMEYSCSNSVLHSVEWKYIRPYVGFKEYGEFDNGIDTDNRIYIQGRISPPDNHSYYECVN